MHSAITMAEIRSNPDVILGQMVFCIIYVVLLCFLLGRRVNVFYGDLKEYYLGTVNKVYNHTKKVEVVFDQGEYCNMSFADIFKLLVCNTI